MKYFKNTQRLRAFISVVGSPWLVDRFPPLFVVKARDLLNELKELTYDLDSKEGDFRDRKK